MDIGSFLVKKWYFRVFFHKNLNDMSKNVILDPHKHPPGKIFGLLGFLEPEKHKINDVGQKLEFWRIFQKTKIFEKIAKILLKSKIIGHRWSKLSTGGMLMSLKHKYDVVAHLSHDLAHFQSYFQIPIRK